MRTKRCIQQPVPLAQLEDFLAQDIEQNSLPEEQSTLVHAVARDVDPVQQADHTHNQTWHRQEMEKRRRMMARPAWKSKQRAFQPSPTTLAGMTPLTSIQENQASAPAVPVSRPDPSSSSSESTWDAWCDQQESGNNFH